MELTRGYSSSSENFDEPLIKTRSGMDRFDPEFENWLEEKNERVKKIAGRWRRKVADRQREKSVQIDDY